MNENADTIQWLLNSGEPWTQYNTRRHLLGQAENELAVQQSRRAMLANFGVRADDPGMQRFIRAQADDNGRYIAGSMYLSWKGWSFSDSFFNFLSFDMERFSPPYHPHISEF